MREVPTSSALSNAQPFIVPLGVPVKSVLAVEAASPPPELQAASTSAATGRTAMAQRCLLLMGAPFPPRSATLQVGDGPWPGRGGRGPESGDLRPAGPV